MRRGPGEHAVATPPPPPPSAAAPAHEPLWRRAARIALLPAAVGIVAVRAAGRACGLSVRASAAAAAVSVAVPVAGFLLVVLGLLVLVGLPFGAVLLVGFVVFAPVTVPATAALVYAAACAVQQMRTVAEEESSGGRRWAGGRARAGSTRYGAKPRVWERRPVPLDDAGAWTGEEEWPHGAASHSPSYASLGSSFETSDDSEFGDDPGAAAGAPSLVDFFREVRVARVATTVE